MKTDQELFDIAVGGVVAQGARAEFDGRCSYRTDSGLRCAVGHIIKDHYNPDVEGFNVSSALDVAKWPAGHHNKGEIALNKALLASGVSAQQYDMLSELQRAHDSSWTMEGFVEKANAVAARRQLRPYGGKRNGTTDDARC